jgi:hypothetical protein
MANKIASIAPRCTSDQTMTPPEIGELLTAQTAQPVATLTTAPMAAVTSVLMATIGPVSIRSVVGLVGKMQNNKMPKVINFVIFFVCSVVLLADVAFIIWAMRLNLLIVLPSVLSGAYLWYAAACLTILK